MNNQKNPNERVDSFIKEYDALCQKYEVVLMAYPQYVPSGKTGFTTITQLIPIDRRDKGTLSPIQNELAK
jgi:hypothetical protein